MRLKQLWATIASMFKGRAGSEKGPASVSGRPARASPGDQRLPMAQADRWSRMLKALQIARSALLPALARELARGMDESERRIEPKKEGMFFDGLMVGRQIEALEAFCLELDPDAVTERVMGKIPSLRDWAIGALTEDSLTRAGNAEVVAWAREGGRFRQGELREAHLAEAIEGGHLGLAKRDMADAGLDKLDAAQMQGFMEAFATRKEAGASAGLDGQGLEAFAAAMGGWESAIEACAGLGREEMLKMVDDLMKAVEDEELLDKKFFEKAKAATGKRAREMIAKAMAAQAAKSDRPTALRSALAALAEAAGVSLEKAGRMKAEGAHVRIGAMEVKTAIEGGLTLHEIAKISGSANAQMALESIAKSKPIEASRMASIIEDVDKAVRSTVMRASGGQRASTKAWRETVKMWKEGMLTGASLAQMQAMVDTKVASSPAPAEPSEPPARPKL